CTLDIECVSGACARTACGAGCCPGTCATGVEDRRMPIGAGEGQSCAQDRCQAGLYCKGAAPICIRPSASGQECVDNSCDCTAFCNNATKICGPLPAVGDPCTGISECGRALTCINGACVIPGALGDACV